MSTNFIERPKYQMSQKNRPVAIALFRNDRRTDKHYKTNTRFPKLFCELQAGNFMGEIYVN